MPTVNLTEKEIKKLKAPDPSCKQVLWWDGGGKEALKGFGVLCSGTTSAKSYVVQRYLPGRKSPRRFTIASVAELDLKAARDRAAKLLLGMRDGIDPKAGRLGAASPTLRQVLDDYLRMRSSLAERSKESYRALVERHLADWLDRELKSITPEDVEAKHRAIKESVEARYRAMKASAEARGLDYSGIAHSGNATANGVMVALRTLWNWQADRDESMPASPTRRLKRRWFPVHRRERHVRADQLPAFYEAVRGLPNPIARDYLLLLLFTGLRRREAASLTWEDVDMTTRVIRISARGTKAKRKLDLPMSDFVFGIFMERQRLGREKFIFPSDGQSGHIEEPKSFFEQIAAASGIRVSAHDLRRTYITTAEATVSPLTVKALVNHALPRDVTSDYVMMTVESLRRPAQKVANRMKKLCGVAPVTGKNVAKLERPAA